MSGRLGLLCHRLVTQSVTEVARHYIWSASKAIFHNTRRGGEIGRREGLKIPWELPPVRVQIPPPALISG